MDYEYKIGTKVFGDWEIVEELGSGAYGTVYEIHRLITESGPNPL